MACRGLSATGRVGCRWRARGGGCPYLVLFAQERENREAEEPSPWEGSSSASLPVSDEGEREPQGPLASPSSHEGELGTCGTSSAVAFDGVHDLVGDGVVLVAGQDALHLADAHLAEAVDELQVIEQLLQLRAGTGLGLARSPGAGVDRVDVQLTDVGGDARTRAQVDLVRGTSDVGVAGPDEPAVAVVLAGTDGGHDGSLPSAHEYV